MLRFPSLSYVLCTAAGAQTFVVDANNGPGTHFTDLVVAVAAVPDGATLLVRPGSYGPIALQAKGLTVVGGPGVVLNGVLSPAVDVSGLLAHQSFSLRGAVMGWAVHGGPVRLVGNAGRVVLQDFRYSYLTSPVLGSLTSLPAGIVVRDCAQVVLRGCAITGSNALDASGSSVDLEACVLRGSGSTTILYHNPVFAGTPALLAANCSVRAANTTITGGPGPHALVPASPAITLAGSQLWLGGTCSVDVAYPYGTLAGVPAIQGAGSVYRDPMVALVPVAPAPAVIGVVDVVQPWPAVQASDARLGQAMTATVYGAHGELCLLCVSLPGAPTAVPGIAGTLQLDLAVAQLLAFGVQSPQAPVVHTVQLPGTAVLLGRPRAWQAASYGAVHGLQLSNVSMQTLMP